MNRIWDIYMLWFVHYQRLKCVHRTPIIMEQKTTLKTVICNALIMFPESDGEDTAAESRTGVLVVAPKQMSSALGSLVANYGSMSESESDEEPESECLRCTQHESSCVSGMWGVVCSSGNSLFLYAICK